jgi:hypothetical protein
MLRRLLMEARERLFNELRTLCTATGSDYEKVNTELSEFIGRDKIVDYYIAKGQLPSFPDVVFDVMVLGKEGLYDCEMKQKGALFHFVPLSKIIEIAEKFKEPEHLTIYFKVGELGVGTVIEDKLSESKNMRMFVRAVRNEIVRR